MLSTLTRSAATLGVVAGLLAGAGPASARLDDLAQTPQAAGVGNVEAPSKATEHEGAAFRGEVTGLEPHALGTQIGIED